MRLKNLLSGKFFEYRTCSDEKMQIACGFMGFVL